MDKQRSRKLVEGENKLRRRWKKGIPAVLRKWGERGLSQASHTWRQSRKKTRYDCGCSFQKDTKPGSSQRSTVKGGKTMIIVDTTDIVIHMQVKQKNK